MQEIRQIPIDQIDAFVDVIRNAYPAMSINTDDDRKRLTDRVVYQIEHDNTHLYGLYRGDVLLGGLLLHDYVMTLRGHQLATGGGGMLGVSLAHKKEHVALDLVRYFFDHYRAQDYTMAILWPFRHDFYRDMGAGYGAPGMHYRFRPLQLPRGESKAHVRELTVDDAPLIAECASRVAAGINGMLQASEAAYRQWMRVGHQSRWYGFVRDGRVDGFINFQFKKGASGSFVHNEIDIMQWVYQDREVLMELATFLRAQADQIEMISFTSYDPCFHHLLLDPRNDSRRMYFPVSHEIGAGTLGVMYRILDTEKLFGKLTATSFNNISATIGLHLEDNFIQDNDGYYRLIFRDNEPPQVSRDLGEIDVTVRMGAADFTSLMMGAVDFRSLHLYGRVEIGDTGKIELIDRIFHAPSRPYCITPF